MKKKLGKLYKWLTTWHRRKLSPTTHGLGNQIGLSLNDAAREALQQLMDRSEKRNPVRLFRKCFATYDILTEHLSDGGIIILRSADGTRQKFDPIALSIEPLNDE